MKHKLLIYLLGCLVAASTSSAQPEVVSLKDAVMLAQKSSPQISSASASVTIASAEVDKAAAAMNPRLTLQSSYLHLSDETVFGATPVWKKTTTSNTISAEMPIYTGGQLDASLQQARFGRSAATAMQLAVTHRILSQTAAAYFQAVKARDSIQIADASIKANQSSQDNARKLYEAGVVTKSDVLRADVALAGANERKIQAVNQYKSALAALNAVIGVSSDRQIIPSDNDAGLSAGDLSSVTSQRQEMIAASERLKASQSAIKAAKAGRFPSVALHADFYNEPRGSEFPRTSDTLLAGVVVRFNIFDGGITSANLKQANAVRDKAAAELDALKRQVEMEQSIASNNLESARARLLTTSTQVASAEESFRSLQAGYTEGITPLTDVLTAEAVLTEARISRLNAEQDEKIATIEWLQAYGHIERILN